jgi:hypothetical protein
MNRKIIMASSAVVLGAAGIILTFAPDVALSSINAELNPTTLLLLKIMGGLYLGYSVMNWMSKESLIGGIYNRPIAIANFWHFFVAGLPIVKALIVNPDLPLVIWGVGIIYTLLGILFGIILFTHPIKT